MNFYDIEHKFDFLLDEFGFELIKVERWDNKSEFAFVYFNKIAKRRIWVDYNGNPNQSVKVYRTSTPLKNLINMFNLGFNEYWISEYIEEISGGVLSNNDLVKEYKSELYMKDYYEQAKNATILYQKVLRTYLKDVFSGKEWVNWKRRRKIHNFRNLFSKDN